MRPPRRPQNHAAPARRGAARALLLIVIGVLLGLVGERILGRLTRDADGRRWDEFEQALGLVEQTFVEPRETDALLDGALRGVASTLDPYSRYYDRSETTRLERETTGQYDGIGVLFAPTGERWRVLFPLPDSPAAEAGLGVGDLILSVGDVSANELDFPSLRERLGDGDAGPVALEVEDRAGERRTVAVTPAQVLDPSVRRIRMIEHGDLDVGYLSIGSFTRRTAGEFDVVTRELRTRGADAFVIDLRGNLGGVLDSALAIADRFVPEGALLQTESRSGVEISWSTPSETTLRDVPVAVLIDRDSASASEVLAGALQDHRLGVLVGEPSYGKGTVQTLTRLPELEGVLRVTTAVYRTPSGRLIERSLGGAWDAGLAPDLEVELDDDRHLAIREYLASFGPRLEHQIAVRAWQSEVDVQLIRSHPDDPQLDAALELLAGRHPSDLARADDDSVDEG